MHFIDVRHPNQVDEYNNLIRGRHAIVVFYMDGCGYCELLKPEWHDFEEELKKGKNHKDKLDDFVIARVNANHINRVHGHNKVIGYPTIMHLLDGKLKKEYNDERKKEALMKFFDEIKARKQVGGKRKRKRKSQRKQTQRRLKKSRKSRSKHSKRKTIRRRK